MPAIKPTPLVLLCFFTLIVLVLFYPLFYTTYIYTDEVVQLWYYKKGSGFQMFANQWRYITEKLFQWLFPKATTIEQVTNIRLFSLAGWLLCLPVWYFVIKEVATKERLPVLLPFFSVLYLICMPQFSIYVSWASCLEMFIANTAGLLSGFVLYRSVPVEESRRVPAKAILLSVALGVISLFTYQNGFGCYLLPFILCLVANPRKTKVVFIGLGVYFFIYLVYYLLFKYYLSLQHMGASGRTSLYIDPWGKLKFFFTRPLSSAFHFTYLFNEKSIAGFVVYCVVFAAWLIATFKLLRPYTVGERVKHMAILLALLVLIYLPSLLVRENYASNRTLFALNMAVFFLSAYTLFRLIKLQKLRVVAATVSLLFVLNAWYNFRVLFLRPVAQEYQQLRAFIEKNYSKGITTVYFIRPEEDFFVRQYGITRSWDEFGVPSSFFNWVPEFLVKQVVFEKTGDHSLADQLTVKSWLGQEAYLHSGEPVSDTVLLIDAENILSHH